MENVERISNDLKKRAEERTPTLKEYFFIGIVALIALGGIFFITGRPYLHSLNPTEEEYARCPVRNFADENGKCGVCKDCPTEQPPNSITCLRSSFGDSWAAADCIIEIREEGKQWEDR